MARNEMVFSQVMKEQNQGPETRKNLLAAIERELKRPVVTFFTSFRFPVMIEDEDVKMLEDALQKTDLKNGLAFIINSPGGSSLAAERMVRICRSYSGTGDYWAIVPGKAKSAATMISFGASKIFMGESSELGPVDPQVIVSTENGTRARVYSAHNIVTSYEDLFKRAVEEKNGNLQPYLQQLANYDEREIKELKSMIELSEDISVRTLSSGMMKGLSTDKIKENIKIFLTPEVTKNHGRPIYYEDAVQCGLVVEKLKPNTKLWELLYELYVRTDNYVSTFATKCIESKNYALMVPSRRRVKSGE